MEETRRPWAVPTPVWRPYATYVLLGSIAAVYVAQQLALGSQQAIAWRGINYTLHHFLFVITADWMYRPWTLVSSTLAHSPFGINHILFNGMFLFFFGPVVERLVGRARFVALFLGAGALAGAVQVHAVAYLDFGNPMVVASGALGASGGLMALFGILMVLTPKEKISLYFLVPVPLWIAGIGYAALDVLGVFYPSGIGNFAHLSGMALGLAYGTWVKADWKRRGMRLVYE